MDLGTILGVLVGIAVPTVGAVFAYGKLNQSVKDQGVEIDEVKVRVDRAEDAALRVGGLAQAVEHMGQQLAAEIKHVVSTFTIETGHTRAQLADIKEELRSVRTGKRRPASDDQ